MIDFKLQREQMVRDHLSARGVNDERVLNAMRKVPRENFIAAGFQVSAYTDRPLPIAAEQTISQPFIVALMIEALCLSGNEKILEVGAGSGYAAAILAELGAQVCAIECIDELAKAAAERIEALGYRNVQVLTTDGSLGWPDEAPFDAILVSAGAPAVPRSLKAQLKIGGRLVIPTGTSVQVQKLVRITRVEQDKYRSEDLADVCFVPLIGEQGWQPTDPAPTTTGA